MVERERATGSDTSGRGQPKRTALLQGADTGPCCRADPPTHPPTHTHTDKRTYQTLAEKGKVDQVAAAGRARVPCARAS